MWGFNYPPPPFGFNYPPPSTVFYFDRWGNRSILPPASFPHSDNPPPNYSPKQISNSSKDSTTVGDVNQLKEPGKNNTTVSNLSKNVHSPVTNSQKPASSNIVDIVTITKANVNPKVDDRTLTKQDSLPKSIEHKEPQEISTDQKPQLQSLPKIVDNQPSRGISICQKTQEKSLHISVQDQPPKGVSNESLSRGLGFDTTKGTATSQKQPNFAEKNNSQKNPNASEGNKTITIEKSTLEIIALESSKTTLKMPAEPLPKISPELSVTRIRLDCNQQKSTCQEEHTSNVQIPEPAPGSVLKVLSCSECKKWVSSNNVALCNCRVICESCMVTVTCEQCNTSFQADSRFINFHQRISSTTSHPCRYQPFCNHTVKPGDPHEESCQFAPKPCFLCRKPVQDLKEHCKSSHQGQVLLDNSNDVKYSDFVKVELTGQRLVYGLIQGIKIPIKRQIVDNEAMFSIPDPDFKGTACTITVKFEFQVKSYSFKEERKIAFNDQFESEAVKIPADVFRDWRDGKNKLRIIFRVRNKRKMSGHTKTSNKKRKQTAEEADGNSSNCEVYDEESL